MSVIQNNDHGLTGGTTVAGRQHELIVEAAEQPLGLRETLKRLIARHLTPTRPHDAELRSPIAVTTRQDVFSFINRGAAPKVQRALVDDHIRVVGRRSPVEWMTTRLSRLAVRMRTAARDLSMG